MKRQLLCICSIIAIATASPALAAQADIPEGSEICIDGQIFSQDVVRLNTEVYRIAESYCKRDKLAAYFGEDCSKFVWSVKANLSPLAVLTLTTSETPNYADRSIMWTSAVYTKPLAAAGFSQWGKLRVMEVDSDFYIYNGLQEYFTCGVHSHSADGSLHVAYSGRSFNDNDSLGPMQILRRYLYHAGGCIVAYNADGSVYGTTADLMRWEDNVVWVLDNALSKFRSISSNSGRGNYSVQNEYELFLLIAVAHNTGASFLTAAENSYVSPYWNTAGGIWQYIRVLTTDDNIAHLNKTYIDPWYEKTVIPSVLAGRSFSLPGNIFSDGDVLQEHASKLLTELGVALKRVTYTKTDDAGNQISCTGWKSVDGYFDVLEHKQRYPLKSLVNYLALQRLYHSGEGK